jgi:hypothetical protein
LMCLVYLFAFPYLRVFKDRSVDGVVRIIWNTASILSVANCKISEH